MVNKSVGQGKSVPPGRSGSARAHTGGVAGASRRRRARGRPKTHEAEDVRAKLLTAASELFLRYGYRAVSSRQIAAGAGANVAMIRYYFGGKPGLYRQIVQGVLQPMRSRIDAMSEGGASVELGVLIGGVARAWAANPWIAGLVLREVLMPDAPLREMFLREVPERLAPLVERIVRAEMARGKVRSDLDPRLTVLSMVSLAVFPFLAFPLTSRVFGVRADEEFLQRLIRHSTEVLTRGLQASSVPEKTAPEKTP